MSVIFLALMVIVAGIDLLFAEFPKPCTPTTSSRMFLAFLILAFCVAVDVIGFICMRKK